MNLLAATLQDLKKFDEAEKMHRETLDFMKRILHPDHPIIGDSMNKLAHTL